MNKFKEYDSVVYTDAEGNEIDTFVIYDTDGSGFTRINHANLLVHTSQLKLHPKSLLSNHVPVGDAFSFELLKQLKNKYEQQPEETAAFGVATRSLGLYYKAS